MTLAQTSAASVEGYYRAQAWAEEVLARLRAGEIPAEVEREGEIYSFSYPISDTQSLRVQVRVEGTDYTVLRWQAVSTLVWEGDGELEVWSGS